MDRYVRPAALASVTLGLAALFGIVLWLEVPSRVVWWLALPATAILLGRWGRHRLDESARRWRSAAQSGASLGWFALIMGVLAFVQLPTMLASHVSHNHTKTLEDIHAVLAAGEE